MVGFVTLASLSGCVDKSGSQGDLSPEGSPDILQVFVSDPAESEDPVGSGLALVYGVHPDVNSCGFEDSCPTGLTCVTTANDPLKGHCVTSAGAQPQPTAAIASGQSIRVVVSELLKGSTLESFACACQGAGATGCGATAAWSPSPTDCSTCPDAASTGINESGQCLDINGDGVPDRAALNPGIATITCAGVSGFGTGGSYTTGRGEGYYWPSGNQYTTSTLGWQGLGPAIVIEPAVELPTDTTCSIAISSTVTDKDGNAITAPASQITFHTEPLALVESAPADEETDVEVGLAEVDITFNVSLDEDSVTAAGAVTIEDAAGTPVPGAMVSLDGSTIIIEFPMDSELAPDTDYTVTVKGTVTDAYGKPLGDDVTFTFTTAAAM